MQGTRLEYKAQSKYVCIDTNIYVSHCLDFNHRNFKLLEKFSNQKLVSPIIIDIIENEVKNKIKTGLEESHKKVKTLFNTLPCNMLRDIYKFDLDLESDLKSYLEKFQAHLTSASYKNIPTSNINNGDVFDLYFNCNPPFANHKNKKHEFPDAFICLTLKNYMLTKKGNEKIYVISDDKGIGDFCKNYDKLEEFFDVVNQLKETYDEIVTYVTENQGKISKVVEDKAIDIYYELSDEYVDGEVLDTTVLGTDCIEVNILSLDESIAEVNIFFNVKVKFEVTYVPQEAICYDPEEREFIYTERVKTAINRDYDINVLVGLDIDNINNIDIIDIDVEELDGFID